MALNHLSGRLPRYRNPLPLGMGSVNHVLTVPQRRILFMIPLDDKCNFR